MKSVKWMYVSAMAIAFGMLSLLQLHVMTMMTILNRQKEK